MELESILEFSGQVHKLGETANAHVDVGGRQEANRMPLWTDFWRAKSDRHIKEEPWSFNTITQRAIVLDAISKAETSRLRELRNGNVRWTKSEQDHDESTTNDLRGLLTSMSSVFNQKIEFQTRSRDKMLEKQERHTQIGAKIFENYVRFLSESNQPRVEVQEELKAFGPERFSAMIAENLGTCQITVHRKI